MPPSASFRLRAMRQQGFTLIEMAIVLLIIGLIVGGIMGGQELIKAARMQRIGKEALEIRDAVAVFQSKYGDLPGDISNATKLWGNSGCNNTIAAKPCDGDSNGRLQSSYAAKAAGDSTDVTEAARLWQHLNLAGMFPGAYNGLVQSPSPFLPNVNAPEGPLEGSIFYIAWTVVFGEFRADGTLDGGSFSRVNNMIRFERASNLTDPGSAMSPVDAKALDDKVDDGIAYTGRMLAVSGSAGQGCPFYASKTPADYNLTITTRQCGVRLNYLDSGQSTF